MAPLTSRRDFLVNSGKAGIGVYVSMLGSGLISSCSVITGGNASSKYDSGFSQKPLPYSYSALTDAIDATTMEIHYTKHAAAYATNLQDAARAEGVNMNKPLEDTLRNISKYSTKLRNNGGGHYNHEMFWQSMAPNGGGQPQGKLATAINNSFGSFETFRNQFDDAAKNRFGSGWAWLFVDKDKKLRIGSTANQDNPLMNVADVKGYPVLGLDVWEHAYYLRYQNKRADYINNWWRVVNWNYVQQRFDAAT
jgi:superoxide dismutase, Fe-Mn family